MSLPLPRSLDELLELVRDNQALARRILGDLPPDELTRSPADGGWSAAECLDHLVVTDRLYLERIEEALARCGPSREEGDPLRGGWIGRRIVRFMGPDPRFGTSSPSTFRPRSDDGGVRAGILDEFEAVQERLADTVVAARGLDLEHTRVGSPAFPLLRLKLSDALRFLAFHDRRHLHQVMRTVGVEPGGLEVS